MEQLQQRYGFEVEWRAFELRPEGAAPRQYPPGYMERAWQHISGFAAEYGLAMRRPQQPSRRSRPALEGAKYAQAHGRLAAYNQAVFLARFRDDLDVQDIAVLAELAAGVGLDAADFRQAWLERRHQAEVDADVRQARDWGITGIPTFLVGDRHLVGAQSYAALERLWLGREDL